MKLYMGAQMSLMKKSYTQLLRREYSALVGVVILITLRAKLSGAVYCYRSCL